MNKNILDNRIEIKKLDSRNMLGSLELLSRQVEQILDVSKKIKIPAMYKKVKNIVVLGMGGSTLAADVIKSLFFSELKLPFQIVNGYHVPAFVTKDSLVLVSSYSGTTEEPLKAMVEARVRKSKLLVITSGGELQKWAEVNKIPSLIFTTENNPCGSPRMGLGYSIAGQIMLLHKVGILNVRPGEGDQFVETLKKYQLLFGIQKEISHNLAKQVAEKTKNRSVWYVGSEHVSGSVHIGANQMNENAKRFAGYFLVPELNHHLMEGMMLPQSNKKNILFILIQSNLYDERVQKRYEITKKILDKNNIAYTAYACREKTTLGQVAEVLVLTSYVSYYSALLEGIDPTAIPFVDFFKAQLKK
jgi:glucose/mannose-6-phosphate isomerase